MLPTGNHYLPIRSGLTYLSDIFNDVSHLLSGYFAVILVTLKSNLANLDLF